MLGQFLIIMNCEILRLTVDILSKRISLVAFYTCNIICVSNTYKHRYLVYTYLNKKQIFYYMLYTLYTVETYRDN